jgi:hypothetical protein
MGPVEVVIVSFPRAGMVTSIGPLLERIVHDGHARVIDAVLVSLHDGGSLIITDLDDEVVPSWSRISPHPRPLLNAADAEIAAAELEPGAVSLLVAIEQTWPAEVARIASDIGGRVDLHVRVAPDVARAAARVGT